MTERARLVRALLRLDPSCFAEKVFTTLEPGTLFSHSWHLDHIAWQLQRVLRGEIRRLIINVPPRSGKSIAVTVALPMFALGHDPRRRIICVSHTAELARKFSIDRRTIALTPWYRALFPDMQLSGPRPRDMELRTTAFGFCRAAGVGGAILGLGADLIVVDDPIKALDALSRAERLRVNEFYDNTLLTRLNDKQSGAVVIVMQRLHEDDLVGHVLERDDWEIVSLPAIASHDTEHRLNDDPDAVHRRRTGDVLLPEREPMAVLEQIRRAQGSLTFQAQYQQSPLPPGGNVIRREWLRFYEDIPERFERIMVSWDTASTLNESSDWSVGTVWGSVGLDFYLLDVWRDRVESTDLRRAIETLGREWETDNIIVEETELGRALVQDLRRRGAVRPILHRPIFDKEARLLAQAARFEAGQVHLPLEAQWLAEYIHELLAFPNGRHDDQVDSTSQALHWLTSRTPVPRELTRRNIERRNIVRR